MKYIIASVDNKSIMIDQITDDPLQFISGFEPVDVVNGNTIAWDEQGGLYRFGPSKQNSETRVTKNISIIDVGAWGKNEPVLIKTGENRIEDLRLALENYLAAMERAPRRKFWKRQKDNKKSKMEYDQMTLGELITLAEDKLGPQ